MVESEVRLLQVFWEELTIVGVSGEDKRVASVALTTQPYFGVAAIGDIDGDGGTDFVSTSFTEEEPTDTVVYLLPGAMRAPE